MRCIAQGQDQAGREYWDGLWAEAVLPEPIDHADTDFRNRPDRVMAEYLHDCLGDLKPGSRLLEIGCARSPWLPYFADRYGFSVTGLDYSEPGCAAEREVLRRAGVEAEVIDADMFDPPPELLGSFDVVVSFGVVEHFASTASALSAVGSLTKPGGLVITTVPNMTGAIGWVQRKLNAKVFDIHVPLDAPALAHAHRLAELQVETSDYLLSTNFGVVNLHGLSPTGRNRLAAAGLLQLTRLSKLAWIAEGRIGHLPETRMLAAHVACCARRLPGTSQQ
jgi:2-polyprenyl-3-methyl-5-hydroxy-6-metoxy-1,4-benzoquinol methylase